MSKILKAEFRRTFHHRSNLIFIGITLFFCISFLSFNFPSVFDENAKRALESFQENLAFPNSILLTVSICYSVFFILIPAITSHFVGSDYQTNTWKMILPRTSNRGLLLFCKILNLLIYLLFLCFIAFILVHLCSLIGASWLKTSLFQDSWQISLEKQEKIAEFFAFALWYISLAVLVTIISRSIIVGTFASFAILIICNVINAYSPEVFSIWFAPTHFRNLIPKPDSDVLIVISSRPNVSSLFSWIIVITHVISNFVISFIVLQKQDFTGE